ncbi:VOC family protein [Roseomonas sp. GC11]|uniref:VOC family protein n=1 Tax=Roseomonas sp. GC11 TaxID=2950546 RepID=UPI00210C283A|nr:VOC family protein [Roseomonas sp. GC11]MCQ4160053.1 VOC family protein [Roseomonas sp. GC11]
MSQIPPRLPGIDHPLILVRDIEAARGFYTRLGFTVTPVGRHPWGTSTSLAVLERSALELMGIYDDSLIDEMPVGEFRFGRHMRDALAEREGMSLVALHSRDAAGDRAAMEARGARFNGHIGFRRRVRPPGGEWDEAVVSLEVSVEPELPRIGHFLAQQHKPHLLWVPEWMRHANGATHVAAVTYVAADPAPVLARLARLYGAEAVTPEGAGHVARTEQGVFRVLPALAGGPALPPGEAAGAGIDVAVRDLAAARGVLEANGVAFEALPGALALRDVAACGNVLLRFVEQ